jgi:hypothetical protein
MSALTDCLYTWYKACFCPDDSNFNPSGSTSALMGYNTGHSRYDANIGRSAPEIGHRSVNMGSAAAVDDYNRTMFKVVQVACCQMAGSGLMIAACCNPSGILGYALGTGISGSIACLTGLGCCTRYIVAHKRSKDPNSCIIV